MLEGTVDGRRKQGKPRPRWTDRLVKQNSGRVFTVGERRTAMKNVGVWSDLRPPSSDSWNKQPSKERIRDFV